MTSTREMSPAELAEQLGCSIRCAQQLLRSGEIFGRKTERGWVTTPEAVKAYRLRRAASVFGPSSRRRP